MQRLIRLRKSRDFSLLKNCGDKWVTPAFVVQIIKTTPEPSSPSDIRVGFTASRRIGNAVKRNRAKRIMRALVHNCLDKIPTGVDIVLIARNYILTYQFAQMEHDFKKALSHLSSKLMKSGYHGCDKNHDCSNFGSDS